MSGDEIMFFAFAATSLACAIALLLARDARRAGLAFAACLVALAFVGLLLLAPLAALFELVVGVGVVAMTAGVAGDPGAPRWRREGLVRLASAATIGLLALVFLGTWARQWMTAGAELDKRPDFGSMAAAGEQLVSQSFPMLAIAALLLPCALIAAVVGAARGRGARVEGRG